MNNFENLLLGEKLSHITSRLKGILIIFVVIDHNDWFRQLAPQVFGPMTFHVLGFFLLTFSFGDKPLNFQFFANRVARYLVPFWWSLAASSMGFAYLIQVGQNPEVRIENYFLAAIIGSASLVKSSSGLLMLWFLPCLFGLSCLLALSDSCTSQLARMSIWSLAIATHLGLPYLIDTWMSWVPFGLLIGAYIFVLGLIWRKFLRRRWPAYSGPLSLLIFISCYGLLVLNKVHIEIGTLEIRALRDPRLGLLHALSVFSAMLSLVWLAGCINALRWVESIGERSMLIYLLHPIFYLLLSKLWVSPSQADISTSMLAAHAFMTTMIAVASAFGAAFVITSSTTLSAWITPQTWGNWSPVTRFRMYKKRA
jgi:hypothetical protein